MELPDVELVPLVDNRWLIQLDLHTYGPFTRTELIAIYIQLRSDLPELAILEEPTREVEVDENEW